MESADRILSELKARGITHAAIADVLGVATPNATKLYNPAGKTGKPRRLTYDEGVQLVEAFNLAPRQADEAIPPLSLPVARLVVRYVAARLNADADRIPEQVEELALDIQAFSEFASRPHLRVSESHVEGFFEGLRRQGAQSKRG